MKRMAIVLVVLVATTACTTRYQVRGTEQIYMRPRPIEEFVGTSPEVKKRQITLEHQSVEYFDQFTTGIIEISDDGATNPTQREQVMSMVRQETKDGGVLVVFVHGWHHGPRTCDRDLCCFRRVLQQLLVARQERQRRELAARPDAALAARYAKEKVVGVYIGWRGESLAAPIANIPTLFDRKRAAERIGRTAGKEILQELDCWWRKVDNLTMVTVGHSLGGAFVYQAMKGKLTGDVSGIEVPSRRPYRIVRAHDDRAAVDGRKAERADLGDLVVLVNPAIEAVAYEPFDRDLRDDRAPAEPDALRERRLPYDKKAAYETGQMPVLMVVASRADKDVKRYLPAGRWLQALVTLRWNRLFRPVTLVGMGRYDPFVTHELAYTGTALLQTADPHQSDVPSCDCPMAYAGLMNLGGLSLQKTGERQAFGDGFVLEPTKDRLARGWDSNSPYFSVFTDANVMSAHSDIFNSRFVGFLLAFINAYDERASVYEPKDKEYEAREAPSCGPAWREIEGPG